MSLLDSTAIFAAIIQQGGFSHAARHLGLSNGMISRRVAQLEAELGVTLLQRTTRQIKLTPEGEIFWQHAQRIQQELDAAVNLIQANSQKPKGTIRITSTLHFGREILTPILLKFMHQFPDISIDLLLTSELLDPIKDNLDLVIRGSGFYDQGMMKDSSMQMKLIFNEEIRLYASMQYLSKHPEPTKPEDLYQHSLVGFVGKAVNEQTEKWHYHHGKKSGVIDVTPKFNSSDIYSNIYACQDGFGIGRFGELHVRSQLQSKTLRPILTDYNWGNYYLYAIYAQQKALPKRTRLLLDFIVCQTSNLKENIN